MHLYSADFVMAMFLLVFCVCLFVLFNCSGILTSSLSVLQSPVTPTGVVIADLSFCMTCLRQWL